MGSLAFSVRILIVLFLIGSKSATAAKTQKVLKNERLLGDARLQIDMLEADYWTRSPRFDCWENTIREQIANVYDKFPESVRAKIEYLRNVSAAADDDDDDEKSTAEDVTPVARFHKWVYMLVNSMDPRVSYLRNGHGNFRRMCYFSANIVYLRCRTLDGYTAHRHFASNDTLLQLEPTDIENIQTCLKTKLGIDDETTEDVVSLFRQVEEVRKDCLDKSSAEQDTIFG